MCGVTIKILKFVRPDYRNFKTGFSMVFMDVLSVSFLCIDTHETFWGYIHFQTFENVQLILLHILQNRKLLQNKNVCLCSQFIKLQVLLVHTMKASEGVEVQLLSFLTSALDWGEWPASCPTLAMLPPGKDPPVTNE